MLYDFDDFLEDVEYYGSMILVGAIVIAIPAIILFLNYKMVMSHG